MICDCSNIAPTNDVLSVDLFINCDIMCNNETLNPCGSTTVPSTRVFYGSGIVFTTASVKVSLLLLLLSIFILFFPDSVRLSNCWRFLTFHCENYDVFEEIRS